MKNLYMTTFLISVAFVNSAWADTNESHCAQYCSGTCDCEWNATTNTLTISSGSFNSGAFKNTNYNINVTGDDISWKSGAFENSSGNIKYSGNGARFTLEAFYNSSSNITFSGNNAQFQEDAFYHSSGKVIYSGNKADFYANAFSGATGDIDFSGDEAKFKSNSFYKTSGDITFSGDKAQFNDGGHFDRSTSNINYSGSEAEFTISGLTNFAGNLTISPESIKVLGDYVFYGGIAEGGHIYCTTTPSLCDAALAKLGHSEITTEACTTTCPASTQTAGGTKRGKRIYTIDEANQVAGKVNRFRIKYR